MVERLNDDVDFMEPILVRLGKEDYEIRPLTIEKSREWTKRFIKEICRVFILLATEPETADRRGEAVKLALQTVPEEMLDLLFSYAPGLPRKRIEHEATHEQITAAFRRLIRIAFPAISQLTDLWKKLEFLNSDGELLRKAEMILAPVKGVQ